jgi:hypothetical protein
MIPSIGDSCFMKSDLGHKKAKMGEHVPGFAGYGAVSYLETDLLLRRHLAAEVEKVRDRLADFIAGGQFSDPVREKLAMCLRTAAFLKDELTPSADEQILPPFLSERDEERLLDFDLALLEKVASLHTPLDMMEAASASRELLEAADLFDEGLAEVDDLYRQRRRILTPLPREG